MTGLLHLLTPRPPHPCQQYPLQRRNFRPDSLPVTKKVKKGYFLRFPRRSKVRQKGWPLSPHRPSNNFGPILWIQSPVSDEIIWRFYFFIINLFLLRILYNTFWLYLFSSNSFQISLPPYPITFMFILSLGKNQKAWESKLWKKDLFIC